MATSMQQKGDDIDPAQQKAEADQTAQQADLGADADSGVAQPENAEQLQMPPVANLRGPASGDSFDLDDDVHLDYEVTSAADCKLHWTLHDKDGNVVNHHHRALSADPEGGTIETDAAINAAAHGLGEGEYEVRYWAENDFGSSEIQSIKLNFIDQAKREEDEIAEMEKEEEDGL